MNATVFADILFVNADIVTVSKQQPAAEAVAVQGGKILAVGSREEVSGHQGPQTRVVDLQGKTLLPGFIDGHSHFISAVQIVTWANVTAPPVGPVTCIADIVDVLKRHVERQAIKPGEWIIGYGYDKDFLADGRELTCDDLDPHFPANPILLIHDSMHGGVLNTMALRTFDITAETVTPPSGIIARKPGSNEPAGLLMEMAYLPVFARLPKPSEEELLARFPQAQEIYARVGITTAQEGGTFSPDLALLEKAAAQGRLVMDVASFVMITDLDKVLETHPASTFGAYHNRLKLGGVKIIADGSVQAKTGFFTQPYLTGGPTGEERWRGEPSYPTETLNKMVKQAYDAGIQVQTHCNGDAAIDMMIAAHEQAAADDLSRDRRTIVNHSQFVRRDQLEKYARYNMIASLFTVHTFFFSGQHMVNLGPERTEFLSPMKTARELGVHCSNHTDFIVTPIDQLFTVFTAVNRVDRKGQIIGPDQRVTPLEALEAITIESAYQLGEEATKGSIEVGKLADFVVLGANPLKVDPMTIKDIPVLETIKEGQTIWSAAPAVAT